MPSSDTPFSQALTFTLKWEGGYSNNVADPGGETMMGVTKKVYDAWRTKQGLPIRSVKDIEATELHSIYYNGYWLASACDKMEPPLSTAVFDTAVNMGKDRAIRHLQRILCVHDDGIWGPQSQAALDAATTTAEDISGLTEDYIDLRDSFYHKLALAKPRLAVFLKGWLRRTAALRKTCGV